MKLKYLIALLVIVLVLWLIYFSSQSIENIKFSPKPAAETPASFKLSGTEQLPTVTSVHLAVKDTSGTNFPELTLKPGELAPLLGTPYHLRVTQFYTHWNWDRRAINLSYNPQNPAVKVEILRDGEMIAYHWAFQKVPFFRLSGMGGQTFAEGGEYAFSLLSYDGLKIPVDRCCGQ